jgi:hypothetical protein
VDIMMRVVDSHQPKGHCRLHPIIHTFGSRAHATRWYGGEKGLDDESLRFFLGIPIEMVQTLHLQSLQAVLGAFLGGLNGIIFSEIQLTAGI